MTGTRAPILLALLASAACPHQLTDADVYQELIACGAMGYYGGVAQEVQNSEDALAEARRIGDRPWLTCVYSGSPPASCGAPCTR